MSISPPSPVDRLHPVLFELWLPNGPNITWQVVRLHGIEALSTPYEFVLDLITDDPLASYEEMLGADAELLLDRNGVVRVVYGIIDEVQAVMSAESRVASAGLVVRARIVPAFKLLDQQLDTRFFAGQTVVEIVRDVLTAALEPYQRTIDASASVKGTYAKRDYCVQFRETTFAFCSRILEEEGISYQFVNDDDEHKEKLVLIDSNADYREVELLVADAIPIVLSRPDELDRESIQAFDWRDARTPNRVLTRGYNFKVATTPDEGSAERTDPHNPGTREQFLDDDRRQIVDDPINDPEAQSFTGADLAQRVPLAERLLQLHTQESAIGQGRANAIGFGPGRTFTLGEHPQASLDHHRFLLTRVVHEGAIGGSSGSPERSYANRFDCVPVEHEHRPALRTAKPRVYGIQTGVVVGRAQDEIYTDQFGRIRVKFHRDRHSGNDEQASCWIRVAQVWAGSGFGAVVIPRVGMEVVVSFVDGNPDCPLVTGCVYDSQNMPPYPLPAEMTKTTFKTASSPGGEGFNELRFEDAHGSEQVFIHAQRRMDVRVRGSLYETCGGSREERVGWERGDDQGGDHNTLVHKDVNHHVKEIRYTKVEKEQYETVMLDLIEDFQTKHMVLVGEVSQLSAPKVVVEASDKISHKAGAILVTGSSTVDIKGGGKVAIESNNAIEMKVGGSFISITPGGIAIQGVSVRINSGGGVGPASEGEAAVSVEMLDPLDALGADDGQIHHGGGGGGGGGRTRTGRTLDPHHAPPMQPPPPPPPGHPTVQPDGTLRQFLTIEWVEVETWCSEPATLRGTTQGYTDGDTESADVRNTSDGAVQRAQTLTITSNAYSQAFDVVNLLPRRVGANFETERTLDAIAVGQTTPTAIRLRFIPTLTSTHCTINSSHFDLSVTNYEALMGGTINYVPGWIQFIIQLGATVPAGTGGNCGVNFGTPTAGSFSGTDWRYAKRSTTTGGLLYWNGTAWTAVPATWSDPANVLLYPIAIWIEGGTNHTQFGTTAWPEAIPAWGATETTLATTTLATWTTNINATWTGKFDLKRVECRSTDAQCCRYKTRCSVTFVQVAVKGSGIVLAANNARSNAGVWSLGDTRAGMPPHEFGHHLGNPDEYAGGVGIDASVNTDGATAGIDPNSIMGANLSTVKRRHYNTICKHLAAMVSTQFGRTYTYNAVPVV
ncbi:type VI secretion system Vgr family protein [Nannocystaceae bacterium ST9]